VAKVNSGACLDPGHICSAILQRATGKEFLEFATKRLFQPLPLRHYPSGSWEFPW